jgi:hypothetical protein
MSEKHRGKSRQRAMVIGVSDYPAPIKKRPAVAADVKEIAKLLRSKNGAFPSSCDGPHRQTGHPRVIAFRGDEPWANRLC